MRTTLRNGSFSLLSEEYIIREKAKQNMPHETKTVGPPPSPEVGLRTLSSDVKSIASGEAHPQAQIVRLSGQPSPTPKQATPNEAPPAKEKKSKFLLWVIVLAVLIALGAGAYFFFFADSSQEPVLEIEASQSN